MREGAGLLDRSERGKLSVSGAEAAEYLQGQLTNDIEALEPDQGCYAALLDRKGHVVADMTGPPPEPLSRRRDLARHRGGALSRSASTWRPTRSAARSRSTTSTSEWAITSLIGPRAAEVAGDSPALAGAQPALLRARRDQDPRGRHRPRARPDHPPPTPRRCASSCSPRVPNRSARRPPRSSGSRRAGPGSGRDRRQRRCRPRPGSSSGRSTSRRAATSARSRSPACTTAASRTGGWSGCGSAPPPSGAPALRLGEREVGAIGTACVSPALGPIALAVVRREAEAGDRLEVGDGELTAEVVELPFS